MKKIFKYDNVKKHLRQIALIAIGSLSLSAGQVQAQGHLGKIFQEKLEKFDKVMDAVNRPEWELKKARSRLEKKVEHDKYQWEVMNMEVNNRINKVRRVAEKTGRVLGVGQQSFVEDGQNNVSSGQKSSVRVVRRAPRSNGYE